MARGKKSKTAKVIEIVGEKALLRNPEGREFVRSVERVRVLPSAGAA
jgi:hypothetical protein